MHVAFYLWYGNLELDGKWMHWDHATLPHWTPAMNKAHPPGVPFTPPDKPHSPFYPARGLYSSRDESVLRSQLSALAQAGVDSIMLSWWGQKQKDIQRDSQGVSTDELVPAVLEAAAEMGIGVTWHLEPYGGRSPRSVLDDLRYLHAQYGSHPAIWRQRRSGGARMLPVVFLYDVSAEHTSGGTPAEQREKRAGWKDLVATVRDTEHDAILLSLYVDSRDDAFVAETGVDGAYSYFAADGFTEGSKASGWAATARRMAASGKVFLPSVGPGYNDTLIRPWNAPQTRPRRRGEYYDEKWRAALGALDSVGDGVGGITITSFNEWGEGTQIEEARPHVVPSSGSAYADYGPDGPDFYMNRTRTWIDAVRKRCGEDGIEDEDQDGTPASSSRVVRRDQHERMHAEL